MHRTRRHAVVSLVTASLVVVLMAQDALAAGEFATPAFRDRWQKDERLVTNFWGPLALAAEGLTEPYVYASLCGGGGPCLQSPELNRRTVQYFDKGRMEIGTSPPTGQFVTSGLLVREMISGEMQTGDSQFEKRAPAAIAIAGDPDNTFPKYSDLTTAKIPPVRAAGSPVDTQLNPDGSTSAIANPPAEPASAIATTDAATSIAVPAVFNEFRARAGVDVIGYAISGPFYVNVRVGGVQRRVLMQAFERRVLTYNAANPPQFQVEFGNVGRHYYRWRYGMDMPG